MNSVVETQSKPESVAEKEAISEQLEKIIAHSSFKNGKRCPNFLRYVVLHRLQGDTELKERTIGVDLFGRDANYDTGSDPVVRTAASEVRKRIAQYYHETGHQNELRIELPLGSYLPEFYQPAIPGPSSATSHEPIANTSADGSFVSKPTRAGWLRFAILSALIVAITVGTVALRNYRNRSSVDRFWSPAVNLPGSILLCVGTRATPFTPLSLNLSGATEPAANSSDVLSITDVVALSKITEFLGKTSTSYYVQGAGETTLTDLAKSPVVLIGGGSNQWTQRMTEPLRFYFVKPGPEIPAWIGDQKNPGTKYHLTNSDTPGTIEDYGIVGRFLDRTTERMTFVMAGIGAAGTAAAADFVTKNDYMDALAHRSPKDWVSKNVEVLVSVSVIDGRPGPPHIEATEVW